MFLVVGYGEFTECFGMLRKPQHLNINRFIISMCMCLVVVSFKKLSDSRRSVRLLATCSGVRHNAYRFVDGVNLALQAA